MHHWTKGIMGDDPPYLAVGTEVSAKYKGAFCEAKVRKVVRSVKCKVTFKLGLGAAIVADDQVRGTLRVGSVCEVKHPEKKEFVQATINKITDSSQYTVVFDDGDITTLRRTALCLKSGRHFAVSETLDQLPLTHPEHFSNPVIGGRKGRRSRQAQDDTSDEEDTARRGSKKKEKEADIGRVVSVELGDKKKQKDNWFPGLVVAPTAQDTVRIRVRDEYLVRSFKDGRYFTVPKKEASEFSRELGNKVENNSLKSAVEKALLFLDRDELPPHWDRDVLFGIDESSAVSDSDGALDSDSSDDEPREEKDHFVAQLYKFMDDRGTPINNEPTVCNKDIDLFKLFKVVTKLGGYNRVTNQNQWKTIARKVGFDQGGPNIKNLVKQAYKRLLHSFEEFYRKLGCTMVNHPRQGRHHGGRSLIRDRDRATPVHVLKDKAGPSSAETLAESPDHGSKPEAASSETPSDEANKSKAETSEKPLVVDDKPKVLREEKTREDATTSENIVQKEEPVKKDKETRNLIKLDKEAKKDMLKKEKEIKKEKLMEEKDKAKVVDVISKDKPGKQPKESEPIESPVQVKETPLKPAVVPVKAEVAEKTPVLTKKEAIKSKEDKMKKLRECKVKLTKTIKSEPLEVEASPDLEEQIKERAQEKDDSDKSSDDEKSDNSKRKGMKREEDDKQVTRSKSREDVHSKSDSTASDRRSRDFDKPFTPRPKKGDDEDEPKKRGRKRKDADKPNQEETLGQLGVGIGVGVGDKLKVYYGPTHESKVTYEAKVIEVEKETYLVHYTGWNTRYDEWIKRGRIAENLSWTPSRAKRLRLQQAKANAKSPRPLLSKRGRPSTSGRELPRPRSTTPSSVTSSSSRTKSPGTPAPRNIRPPLGPDYRRRTRKMSGHTDISLPSMSASESEDSESDVEPTMTRRRSERGEKDDNKMLLRKKAVELEDEAAEDSGEQSSAVSDPQPGQRRSTRTRKPVNLTPDRKEDDHKRDVGTESDEEHTQPKGRDFDLNQIRSELKGIEKAVKPPQDIGLAAEGKDPSVIVDNKTVHTETRRLSVEKEALNKVAEVKKTPGKTQEVKGAVSKVDSKALGKSVEPTAIKAACLAESDGSKLSNEKEETVGKVLDVKGVAVKSAVTTVKTSSKVSEIGKGNVKIQESAGKTPDKLLDSPVKTIAKTPESKLTGKSPDVQGKAVAKTPEPPGKASVKTPESQGKARTPDTPGKAGSKTPEVRVMSLKSSENSVKAGAKPSDTTGKINVLHPEVPISSTSSSTDDIYEFKEPEPFEFEVRAKREPVLVEDRAKPSRKSTKPVELEEVTPPKVVKSPLSRKKLVRNASLKPEGKDVVVAIKKRLKRAIGSPAKVDPPLEVKKEVVAEPADPVTPQKVQCTSACEEAFDKLCESPVFRPAIQRRTPLPGQEFEPLSLFGELPGDGKDDHDDRLVISETDEMEAESQEPLFTYSQRHHEELLPTLTSDISSVGILRENFNDSPQLPNVVPLTLSKVLEVPPAAVSPVIVKIAPPLRRASVKSPGPANVVPSPIPQARKSPGSSPAAINPSVVVKVSSPARSAVSSPIANKVDTPVHITNEETAPTSVVSVDVILPITKGTKGDELQEDTISAAIQRVISQSIAHEDVNKAAASTSQQSEKKTISAQIPSIEQLKREVLLKRKSGLRKPVLSQEFVDDSSSDSSDEEERLVIDKIDDDEDSASFQGEESQPAVSTKRSAEPSVLVLGSPDSLAVKKVAATREARQALEDVTKLQAGPAKKVLEKLITKDEKKQPEKLVKPTLEATKCILPLRKEEQKVIIVEEKLPVNTVSVIQSSDRKEPIQEADDRKGEEDVASDLSLLCEETIPGSPTPAQEHQLSDDGEKAETTESRTMILEMPFASAPGSSVSKNLPLQKPAEIVKPQPRAAELAARLLPAMCARNVDEASAVLENTPPTTPDSSLSITSGSPREEQLSPTMDMDFKSRFEDSSAEGHKGSHYSEDDSLLNIEVSNSSLQDAKQLPKKMSHFDSPSPKKRQRSRKRSECESSKRSKISAMGRAMRGGNASDSDDTSENSGPLTSENIMLLSRSPRPSRYNFYVELDPELDGTQRIALLQQKLQELRKTYLTLKSELAGIDRRRKKLRRREREEKTTKQEVVCV